MPVFVSMLRGVNVGGHCKIAMEALRALYDSLGLRDAQTYIPIRSARCTESRSFALKTTLPLWI